MGNPVFSPEYGVIIESLIQARIEAGLSQRALAKRLRRSQSHVCRIEQQQRRVDMLEFYRIAHALGIDPRRLFGVIVACLDELALAPDGHNAKK